MRIEMLTTRAAIVDGKFSISKRGDVIDVPDEEGVRLIQSNKAKNAAVAPEAPKPRRRTRKKTESSIK